MFATTNLSVCCPGTPGQSALCLLPRQSWLSVCCPGTAGRNVLRLQASRMLSACCSGTNGRSALRLLPRHKRSAPGPLPRHTWPERSPPAVLAQAARALSACCPAQTARTLSVCCPGTNGRSALRLLPRHKRRECSLSAAPALSAGALFVCCPGTHGQSALRLLLRTNRPERSLSADPAQAARTLSVCCSGTVNQDALRLPPRHRQPEQSSSAALAQSDGTHTLSDSDSMVAPAVSPSVTPAQPAGAHAPATLRLLPRNTRPERAPSIPAGCVSTAAPIARGHPGVSLMYCRLLFLPLVPQATAWRLPPLRTACWPLGLWHCRSCPRLRATLLGRSSQQAKIRLFVSTSCLSCGRGGVGHPLPHLCRGQEGLALQPPRLHRLLAAFPSVLACLLRLRPPPPPVGWLRVTPSGQRRAAHAPQRPVRSPPLCPSFVLPVIGALAPLGNTAHPNTSPVTALVSSS